MPATRDALLASARDALREGKPGDALVALWTARDRLPGDAEVRTDLAYVYMSNRWIAQARREIQAALDAGADDARAHYVAGVVLAWTGEGDEAERHLRRALELDPTNAAARAALDALFGP
jgi:Flp pilus assembly protein TadD